MKQWQNPVSRLKAKVIETGHRGRGKGQLET